MSILFRNYILMFAMLLTSIVAIVMAPTEKIAVHQKQFDLEALIPKQFGNWTEVVTQQNQIVDPQQKETIDKIYAQTLSRTYRDNVGNYIMLSIAYGMDQRDANQLHYPEVCYPSQGFQLLSMSSDVITTNFGSINVKKILATKESRHEPITYWTTLGYKVVRGIMETKIEQLHYGLKREIPDGLLFRVSSISLDTENSYAIQAEFVRSLIDHLTAESRLKLAGLSKK